MEGLVAVGLGGADVVLEPAQHRLEHVVHHAQHIVALRDVVHDHPEGVQVENLVHGLVLGVHLAVDGVGVLHPAVDGAADALGVQPVLDALLHRGHKLLVGGGPGGQLVGDLLVAHRVQVAQGGVLQLPLDALHGHEHLAQVLHLLLFLGGILHPRQLGDTLHQVRHRGAEELGNLLMGHPRVLNAVVEEGGDDGVGVQLQLGHDLGHRQGVGDVGRAVLAQLAGVGVVGKGKGVEQPLSVQGRVIAFDFIFQRLIALQNGVHTGTSCFLK